MSGGVDSSTGAYLLKEGGFEVIGISMKLWDGGGKCCSLNDFEDARKVAQKLSIPLYTLNLVEEFEKEVVEYFCQEYSNARTPNPCIICNEKIKFGALLDKAKKIDAPFIATGHYAKVEQNLSTQRYSLKKGEDAKKDQSYFLFSLSQIQLSHIIFPLFNLTKREVRQIAACAELPVYNKKESQEICFIPQKNYNEFLKKRALDSFFKPGLIKDKNGRELGEHAGIHLFTVGQRKGIGGGRKKPFYVIEINKEENTVVVGEREDGYAKTMQIAKVNWVSIPEPQEAIFARVKIRYQHPESLATIYPLNEKKCRVDFLHPQWAITPGQAAVFYEKDTLLGGGWIEKVGRE
ncbi:tRNA 2-thiouridine(34) synthase MnmA [Candidatus Aerophobetes bacterium]|nr:tRNA 2-thiouridine(34) synthase MnmA [Candidatus Aerophobetes bacterium]